MEQQLQQTLPRYSQVSQQFAQQKTPLSPEEAHGLLCGLLCSVQPIEVQDWVQEIIDDGQSWGSLAADFRHQLLQIVSASVFELQDSNYSFSLLLPEDDNLLKQRVLAIAGWCQGFLAGLGLAKGIDLTHADEQVREALVDIKEIAFISDETENSEDEERAYYELVEYVRMAVLLIHRSLTEVKTVSNEVASSETVH